MAHEYRDGQKSVVAALLLGAALIAVVVVGLIILANRGDSEIGTDTREEPSPTISALGQWVDEEMPTYEAERTGEMVSEGFSRLADALDDLAARQPDQQDGGSETPDAPEEDPAPGTEDGADARAAVAGRISMLRSQVTAITSGENPPQAAGQAAMTTAEVVEVLQERRFTTAIAEVRQLRLAAESIDPNTALEEQRDAVESFFSQAHRSLLSLDVPVTPAWIDSPFVNPWPEPTGPDLE